MDELTKRIAKLVAAYIDNVWIHMERAGGVPDTPIDLPGEESNPPIGDYAHKIIDANRVASKYFHWAIEEVYSGSVKSYEGVPYSEVLMQLRYDPGLIQTWRDQDRKMYRGFIEATRWVAKGVVFIHGQSKPEREELIRRLNLDPDDPEALVVRRHPRDEQLTNGDWQKAHNQDNNDKRTRDARAAYEKIYPKWKAFAVGFSSDTPRANVKRAFKAFYERTEKAQISVRKIERAIEYCEKGVYDDSLKFGKDDRRRQEGAA